MEPFGLLNLLKSLLPQTENSAQNDEKTNENAPPQEPLKNETHTAEPAVRGAQQTDICPEGSSSQNAFLDFVSRHDERKKNIKK